MGHVQGGLAIDFLVGETMDVLSSGNRSVETLEVGMES